MNKIHEKKINDIMHTIGLNNNLRDDEIREIVESQFRFTYEIIKKMDLDNLNKEDIDNLKTNFFYKYLGKIYTSGEIVDKHKYKLKKDKEEYDEREHNSV